MLLKKQSNVSPQRGLPVDSKTSAAVTSVSSETVQLYYFSGGTLTQDAGQAAGTVVVGYLAYDRVKNRAGTWEGSKKDSSLSFTSTALTSEVELIPSSFLEGLDDSSEAVRVAAIGAKLAQGEYVVDYANGIIYGKKASTQTSLTSTAYKIKLGGGGGSTSSAGADGVSNTTNSLVTSSRISGFNGTTWDRIKAGITTVTSTLTGWLNTLPWAIYNASPTARTEGQGGPIQSDANGRVIVTLGTAIAGENLNSNRIETAHPATPTRITSATTTTARSGAGILHTILVEAALTGTVTIYDNTAGSGTVLAILPIGFAAGAYTLDIAFGTGCTLVTSAADRVVATTVVR